MLVPASAAIFNLQNLFIQSLIAPARGRTIPDTPLAKAAIATHCTQQLREIAHEGT